MQIHGEAATGLKEPVVRLAAALDQDEFTLFGQQIHDLRTGDASGMAEVLIRQQREEQALLPPGDFLPAFEHYGMLPQLDAWVLRRIVRRHSAGPAGQRFAINVSGQTLSHPQFAGIFLAETRSAGINPAKILFEIEEDDLIARPRDAAQFAAEIKATGGSVVVGGFGRRLDTFSPVAALKPEFVKVDASIVHRFVREESCARKLAAIVCLGNALRIGVVAECVEEPEVINRLRAMGVGYGQGFGFSRPRPMEENRRSALRVPVDASGGVSARIRPMPAPTNEAHPHYAMQRVSA